MGPIDQLIHSTVRIECQTAHGVSCGTGYFFDFLTEGEGSVPCIVTNKHVIEGAQIGAFHMTIKDKDGNPDINNHIPISFDNFERRCIQHPDPNVDLAIFPINPILQEAHQKGIHFYYVTLTADIVAKESFLENISTMEDIIMIGYPNGIWDAKHNLPIVRKGITATHPKLSLNGKPEFMIDAACFPGSSGSPVFLANIGSYMGKDGSVCIGNRISLLGTMYAGPQHSITGEIRVVEVPTKTQALSSSLIPNNLGLVIHGNKLLDFEDILRPMVEAEKQANQIHK
jgi:hypothetical protein